MDELVISNFSRLTRYGHMHDEIQLLFIFRGERHGRIESNE